MYDLCATSSDSIEHCEVSILKTLGLTKRARIGYIITISTKKETGVKKQKEGFVICQSCNYIKHLKWQLIKFVFTHCKVATMNYLLMTENLVYSNDKYELEPVDGS